MSKKHANKGVPRNKKPLQNIAYKFEERDGKFYMFWEYERDMNQGFPWSFHGSVTEDHIRACLTPNQWSKFRQGERQFIRQRRKDGGNVSMENKDS